MINIGVNRLFTLIFGWSLIWVFFAWGLGVANFARAQGKLLGYLGFGCWYLLMLVHFYAVYAVWMDLFPASWWVSFLLLSHLVFGCIFGRNLSAR
ncbi:hypothetical protein [uncultured Microbulbifer sp.]|uniref:hypothetical protein n=1 Tax=uncultured Microbulbifer sp. TaxID=348147 RepID=UPI00263932CB|nr:hypothetical protein [uncultured Microbulbifer sp.]